MTTRQSTCLSAFAGMADEFGTWTSIEGKVVVITGASSGLGEATARLLCAQGASVVLGARRGKALPNGETLT